MSNDDEGRRPPAAEIERAAQVLRAGGLVAFPTETVYGLGADASNPAAVSRIFAAKGRPAGHPLIVHLADPEQIDEWVREVPEAARRLARRFWPGPLTLILPKSARVPSEVTGGQPTVGLRVPSHPVALALLRAFGGGVAAPSANRFGRVSPTRAEHVAADLGSAVDFLLDGGPCLVGVESTIVDATADRLRLLRPGGITVAQLEAEAGQPIQLPGAQAPRVPGTLPSHYAPRTPLAVVPAASLEQTVRRLVALGKRVGVMARGEPPFEASQVVWTQARPDAESYARGLYANLRALDHSGCDVLLAEAVPEGGEWLAVRDRLGRAAYGTRLELLLGDGGA
jgi:L-threonylcarbamoyladenylate synthase